VTDSEKDFHKRFDIELDYSDEYQDPILRGIEDERPWNVTEEVARRVKPTDRLLDIGCGTCVKTLPLATYVAEIWGVDPSASMRAAAARNILKLRCTNVFVRDGIAEQLPFGDEEFDVVTSFVAKHDTQELFRVLKPRGVAIVEKIGDRDKANIKLAFGQDSEGYRGYLLGMKEGERTEIYRSEFSSLFKEVQIRDGRWRTVYSREALIKLCANAKTVRGFDPTRDAKIINGLVRDSGTGDGVETEQHRLLIVARKG
jgi:SAM-dependent methyltransferase